MKNSNQQLVSAEECMAAAEAFFTENNASEAVKYYLHSVLMKRLNPQAYKGLGKAYYSLKKYDKAIDAFEKALEISSFDAELYSELGICYMAKGNCCKAVRNIMQAIKIEPKNTDYQIQLAVCHEIMEEEDMAIMIYGKITETNPDCRKAYVQKASLLMKLERFDDALDVFRSILKVDKTYYRAYLGIGICFDKFGDLAMAKRYYKKYLKLMPDAVNSNSVTQRLFEINKKQPIRQNFLKVV